MNPRLPMRFFYGLALQLLSLFACNGPSADRTGTEQTSVKADTLSGKTDENTGIVYFSADNGNTWKNASKGLPEEIRIGLGGIAASDELLAIASKDDGIFRYHDPDSTWLQIPTDPGILAGNVGALIYVNYAFYAGTQSKGIFVSTDMGKVWKTLNTGLENLTIRRFVVLEDTLYVCTNDGIYSLDEPTQRWIREYGANGLQVNGATRFRNALYIATNQGIYRRNMENVWTNVLPDHSVHNISSDAEQLYGMTYTSLLISSTNGTQWQNLQHGLPQQLYTFNVLNHKGVVLAGQWDGVYKKTPGSASWELTSDGLPANFPVTNLKAYQELFVISTSERKRKEGMTSEKN